MQAQIDEINAARVQEEVEREWRRKEKEEALKKLEALRILQKEREVQVNNKRIMQAIEIERERREFERIVRVQQASFSKEKKELEQKQQQALIHRSEILKQVCTICLRISEKIYILVDILNVYNNMYTYIFFIQHSIDYIIHLFRLDR